MTKRLYDRTSRTLGYADLDEPLRAAIERHAEQRLLGALAPVACVETRSVNLQPRRGGLLGRLTGRNSETEHRTVAILLPQALVAATEGTERGVTVMSTRLVDITAIDRPNPAQVIDSGITVESRWGGPEAASYYVALGDDPAGQAFADALRAAVVTLREKG